MGWKLAALLVLAVSLAGALVRIREGDNIYLSASLIGIGIALWLWRRGEQRPAQTNSESAAD